MIGRFVPRGLQAKLIATTVLLVVVSLGVSGAVFVRLGQADQQRERLDHVAAESSPISTEFFLLQLQGGTLAELTAFVDEAARLHGVRILIVDRQQVIQIDSDGKLAGEPLELRPEAEVAVSGGLRGRPFATFRPQAGTAGDGLILLAAAGQGRPAAPSPGGNPGQGRPATEGRLPFPQGGGPGGGRDAALPYQVVLAVPESDIASAWFDLLPGLGAAAGIALPTAVLLAVLLGRYITRPLRQLTSATQLVSEGRFDVDVPSGRRDEVGQLAASFSTMTHRVGESQAQMRALLADVSHNLKTPLTSILGFSRLIETGEAGDPATVQRMGKVIHEEAGRLADRLEDLLLLSEIESGAALLQRVPVDVGTLVREVSDRVFPAGAAPAPVIQVQDGLLAAADSVKLERALENLLDNARKFTPGNGAIEVRAGRGPGGETVVTVSNTAAPIDPAELPRLFDRFYRREAARAAAVPGTGLGLAVARDIVELHGGTLAAAWAGGRLTMTLSLPGTPGSTA
ncbi:MAG: ATP-binding protein [Dehalococcoidia bacterium]